MLPTERDKFLARPLTAVFATARADGTVHAVPVWYRWREGEFRIITGRSSVKHRNIERTAWATLCIDGGGEAIVYLTAEGPVTVEPTVSRAERLSLWQHYRGDEVAQRTVASGGHERMVMLVLRPERWIG